MILFNVLMCCYGVSFLLYAFMLLSITKKYSWAEAYTFLSANSAYVYFSTFPFISVIATILLSIQYHSTYCRDNKRK